MNPNLTTLDYPIGAGMAQGEQRWAELCDLIDKAPRPLVDMTASPQSAAFIRGLVKSYKLSQEQGWGIAYAVLRVALGEKTLAKLPTTLAEELDLPAEKAKKIADEIEEDLFKPIDEELTEYLKEKRRNVPVKKRDESDKEVVDKDNVLDLKKDKLPPMPPPMPGNTL